MVIGYLRVSTGKQHPANQKNEIIRNRDEIIGLIESRMPVRRICELYGVSRDTFARFRKEFIVRHSGDGTGLPRP